MSHRSFLFAWVAFLLIIALLAAWFTFSPAPSSKSLAASVYRKAAAGAALLSGFFKAHEEIRIELLVGGFFAAVANSYIPSTYLPDTGSMTLMYKINGLGLATIFPCMIQTVTSGRFVNRGETEFSRLFDKVSFSLIAAAYLALNLALPLAAQIH